jgi:hypothetical protein
LRKVKEKTAAFKSAQGLDLLDKDPDLDPLRARPEFHKLQAQVEEEARKRE